MTKEDEARLEEVRRHEKPEVVHFLLRLIDETRADRDSWRRVLEALTAERDEQAARVAALQRALFEIYQGMHPPGRDAQFIALEALDPEFPAPVAPGEVKP